MPMLRYTSHRFTPRNGYSLPELGSRTPRTSRRIRIDSDRYGRPAPVIRDQVNDRR